MCLGNLLARINRGLEVEKPHSTLNVVLEKEQNHYRAIAPALPGCVAAGQTREDAIRQIQQTIADCLKRVEITTVEVEAEPSPDPWMPFIGMWKTDSTWDEFQAEIADYRQQLDKDQQMLRILGQFRD